MQYGSAGFVGRPQVANRGPAGAFAVNEPTDANFDPLIGRKVWTRWPEDNSFYEAVITDYNPIEVCFHCLLLGLLTSSPILHERLDLAPCFLNH